MTSYLIAGHLAEDVTVDGRRPGGTARYAAMAAAGLGCRVRLVTAGPQAGVSLPPVEAQVVPSPCATTFDISWADGRRDLRLLARASELHDHDIPISWRDSDIWHLGPIAGELDVDMLDAVPEEAFLGITPQGWMRSLRLGEVVRPAPWLAADRFVDRAQAVVFSEEDLQAAGSCAARWSSRGCVVVVTAGRSGSTVYQAGRAAHVDAFVRSRLDPVGAGDAYAAAFFIRLRQGEDPVRAARFASAAAALAPTDTDDQGFPSVSEVLRLLGSE